MKYFPFFFKLAFNKKKKTTKKSKKHDLIRVGMLFVELVYILSHTICEKMLQKGKYGTSVYF